jgi:DNA-binding NarL/FixJ family response regulator
LRAGVRGYLYKTSLSNEIIEAIQTVAEGQKYIQTSILQSIIEEYIVLDGKDQALARLSSREREVLQLLIEGHSSAEAAKYLALSVGTIDTYRSRIMRKLQVKDFAELLKFTIQHGLIRLA